MKRTAVGEITLPSKLVVGIDDRGMSDHAVRAALEVSERLGAALELVHAVRVPIAEWMGSDPAKGPAVLGQALEDAQTRINGRVQPLLDVPGSENVRVKVVPGTPAEVLLQAARGNGTILFLGKHEKRSLFDFGSTARTVLAKGDVPVWIQVRSQARVYRILAPVDLSADSLRALSLAVRLAGPLGATIRAVHFFDAAALFAATTPDPLGFTPLVTPVEVRLKVAEDFDRAMESFDWRGIDHTAGIHDGTAVEGILEAAESADLVVMGTHGRTGVTSSVLGGVAHAVLKKSEVPVLAVPYPSRAFRI